MRAAVCENIYVPGAAKVHWSGQLQTLEGETVNGYPYLDLAALFQPSDWSAVSCYSVCAISGELLPWVRFTGPTARLESGWRIQVEWLHLEFDLPTEMGGKIWPGVSAQSGIWTASEDATARCVLFVSELQRSLGRYFDWYMTRGGLHTVQAIAPIEYAYALAYLNEEASRIDVIASDIARRLQIPLKLDITSAQPSRLMWLPQIKKPRVGYLRLPHSGGQQTEDDRVTLPEPAWLATDGPALSGELKLSKPELAWAKNFAKRWLMSHITWLLQALPGTGRNMRAYALGADIRQLSDVGLIDSDEWLTKARETLAQALLRPIHQGEAALMNGFNKGHGTGTLAIAMQDLARLHKQQALVEKMRKTLLG